MYFWGAYANSNYGWDRTGKKPGQVDNTYIRHYFTGGLELAALMQDYYEHTNDEEFRAKTMLPLANDVIRFYDNHYLTDDADMLRIEPGQALETYQKAVTPLPDLAGLQWMIPRLNDPEWKTFKEQLPPYTIGSDTLKPAAEILEPPKNSENPELYAVFPFRIFGHEKPLLDLARKTFYLRRVKDDIGDWRQDAIQAAYLGLTDTARELVERNFSEEPKNSRFPVFWGPKFDWTPDQCHGNATMIALQRMILQADYGRIYLMPAWPRNWDVEFKLHAPNRVVIEGVWRQGHFEKLDVSPKSARQIVTAP
jgi:hypothetical protein